MSSICLNMIVRDEAAVIRRCLDSVKPWIDCWVIVDTGSVDGTQDLIRDCLADIPGELHERLWKNFGHNRSEALVLARDKADYTLVIDADEVLETPSEFRWPELAADGYLLCLRLGGISYWRTALVANRLLWRYEGVLHEYLTCDRECRQENLPGPLIVSFGDGGRSQVDVTEKYARDAHILEQALEEEPDNPRYVFYLAQSYRDSGRLEKSLDTYRRRVELGGWVEEVWYSLYEIARLSERLELEPAIVMEAYLAAYQYRSQRAEPLALLARYCRLREQYVLAHLYAQRAIVIPRPDDILFLDDAVYGWIGLDEYAIACYWVGDYRESERVNRELLDGGRLPGEQRPRIIENLNFALGALGSMDDAGIERIARDPTATEPPKPRATGLYAGMKTVNNSGVKKPILCFYVGYTANYTISECHVYGSEIALKKLSELFAETYDVYIFGTAFHENRIGTINFRNAAQLHEFGRNNAIDIMVVSRYVHYFLEFNIKARKTYLWLHDVLLQPYWNGLELPLGGKSLLENLKTQIDGIIALCDWHKQTILRFLDLDPDRVHIIGNGIDIENFESPPEKVKNRFIWMSNPERGLMNLVHRFHRIRRHLPDAELWIYRGTEEFDPQELRRLEEYDHVKFCGKLPNRELVREIMKAEYWFYPTHYPETYCISALEAQMAGCLCIASDLAALSTTIEDRGILLKNPVYSEAYWDEALSVILRLNGNSGLKASLIEKAKTWAQHQTWKNRAKMWLELFDQ